MPHPALSKFDMASLGEDRAVLLIGRRAVGKSSLIKDILFHLEPNAERLAIFSPTFYGDFAPPECIRGCDPSLIADYVSKRSRACAREHAHVVIDDANNLRSNTSFRSLFVNGRCMRTAVIASIQHPSSIGPWARGNVDYVFIFRDGLECTRKVTYDSYAACVFPSFDAFAQAMDAVEEHECLVIEMGSSEEDRAFWYTAETHDGFRIR